MSKLLQGNLFETTADALTPLSEDRLVNHPVSPADAEAPPMIAGSGLSFCAWCLKSVPCGCWRRILAESLALRLREWNSVNGLRVSLKIEVTASSPSSWLLKTLARRIEESGFGSWVTPQAHDSQGTPDASRHGRYGTKHGGRNLPDQIAAVQMWPTPVVPNGGHQPKGGSMTMTGQTPDGKKRQVDLNYAVKQWPTPTTQVHHDCPSEHRRKSPNLESIVAGQPDPDSPNTNGKSRASLRLNYKWVAQLMGFPSTWFDGVEWPPSKASETRSSRNAPK